MSTTAMTTTTYQLARLGIRSLSAVTARYVHSHLPLLLTLPLAPRLQMTIMLRTTRPGTKLVVRTPLSISSMPLRSGQSQTVVSSWVAVEDLTSSKGSTPA